MANAQAAPRRRIGSQGPAVTAIGLGCMGMSWGYAEGSRDDEASVRVVRQAIDEGVTLFDTARIYGDGHNERLLGRAIEGRRDVVIASKGGLVVDDLEHRRMHRDGRPSTLRRQVEESLTNLGVERIDLYYLHRVDERVPLEESWGELAALVKEGKIAEIGLSEVTVAQADLAHALHPVAAIQSELSLWTRDPLGRAASAWSGSTRTDGSESERDGGAGGGTVADGNLVAWTWDHGAAFVPFAPLGRGYLTGTLTPDAFESNDFRASNPRFTARAFARNRAIGDRVAGIAAAHGATSSQVALSWLLGLADNIIPIPGTRSGTHLAENLAATQLSLTAEERAALDGLPAAFGTRY